MQLPSPVFSPLDTLSNASESLRAIVNTIVDGVVITDDKGTVYWANPATERMLGYPLHELIGHNISKVMPAPHTHQHDDYLRNYLTTGQARVIGIGRRVDGKRKDGSLIPLDLAISEVRLGDARMFAGVMRDMTERQRAEENFQREHAFLESLIETAHAIILVLDREGRIVRFNRFMEELTGFRFSEVRGQEWFTTFLPERDRERIRQLFATCLNGTPIQGHVNPIVTRTGEEKIIAWSARILKDAAGEITGVLSIGNDISELHDAERRLLQSERLAAIGQMMTGLAHESRNALQRAHACLEMLELDLQDRQQQDLTQRARKALDELQCLYDEVRNYAAPLKLERRDCRISDLLEETWEQLKSHRDGKTIRFRTACDPKAARCRIDSLRMQQVFRNILDNAISACGEHGEIDVECESAIHNGKPTIRLSFKDNGTGLNAEQAKGIFEPFYTTKTKGTGLGMPIAKRIIEAHGGEIQIGSEMRSGAEIIIFLPQDET
ncbi:MAG: PAS domain S-box protein [Planctomycetaceae bacterium]